MCGENIRYGEPYFSQLQDNRTYLEDVLNLSGITWIMFRKISQTLASWEEMGCEAKTEEDRELSQLVFLDNLERKKFQVGSHTDYKTRS